MNKSLNLFTGSKSLFHPHPCECAFDEKDKYCINLFELVVYGGYGGTLLCVRFRGSNLTVIYVLVCNISCQHQQIGS